MELQISREIVVGYDNLPEIAALEALEPRSLPALVQGFFAKLGNICRFGHNHSISAF